MCNPPFYTSRDELVESAKQKKRPPFSVNEPSIIHFSCITITLHPCSISSVLTLRQGMHRRRGGDGDPWWRSRFRQKDD